MKKSLVAAMALVAAAGAANAQSVEFRIVEREVPPQLIIPTPVGATAQTDNILAYAVQARVTGGSATQFLGNFSFDVVAAGEADANGTLARIRTSAATGLFDANPTQASNSTIGQGGLAAGYSYLAGLSANFNGLINSSAGTFTNSASAQEIGLVTGSPAGGGLLLLTDADGDGNPDTYPGTGTTAPIDPTVASTYFGAGGNFVDIYRFKYTVSNTTATRTITFNLANATAQLATSLQLSNGVWGPVQANTTVSSNVGVSVLVPGVPAPASAALLGLGGLVAARRRRVA